MNVVVDTSVWVEHFRRRNRDVVALLEGDMVLTHPLIVGELACGTPPEPRLRSLAIVDELRSVNQVSIGQARAFIERERLFGNGCGIVDLLLLSSTLITPGAKLWTGDRRLADLAIRFGVSYPAVHYTEFGHVRRASSLATEERSSRRPLSLASDGHLGPASRRGGRAGRVTQYTSA